MKKTNKKKQLLIGAGVASLILVAVFATNGTLYQGYLGSRSVVTIDETIKKKVLNTKLSNDASNLNKPLRAASKITCNSEVKPNEKPGYVSISWTANVTDATPKKDPKTGEVDLYNPYQIYWYLNDCEKNSGPEGYPGTGIQYSCPQKEKKSTVKVTASFVEADGKNNVATCEVNF